MRPLPLDLVHHREPIHETVAGFLIPQQAALIDCAAAANLPSLESELARRATRGCRCGCTGSVRGT